MGEERLTGLATMTIHRYIHLDVSDIIDRFASTQRKKNIFVVVKVISVFYFL